MVIEKILKQLTPERIKKEIEELQKVKFPPELQKWIKEYEKVGERSSFLWNWSYKVSQIITFPGVPKKYHKSLVKFKFFMIMFIVLLDDVADKTRNKRLLDELVKIPFKKHRIRLGQLKKEDKKYLKFTRKLWHSMEQIIQTYPQYRKFKTIIEYDIKQLLNGMDYAYLVNKNLYLINEHEFQIYLSHNTPSIISYMIDLTCLPSFNMKNLGLIRKVAWYAQIMTRIANWISTWKREIKENDFTSGVFVYAIENDIITIKDLQTNKEKIVDKIKKSKAEEYFLKQWEEFYDKINKLGKRNKSVSANVNQILKTIKKLTILHLISRKLI